MTTMTITNAPRKLKYDDKIIIEDYRGQPYWHAVWYDHASRLVKRRLIAWEEGATKEDVVVLAMEEFDKYRLKVARQLAEREKHGEDELLDMSQVANFPRIVVATMIEVVIDRINRADSATRRYDLFIERVGISERELHRILESEEKIGVGSGVVDRICLEFNLLMDDFIESAFEWAECRGRWNGRPGTNDPWPIGYCRVIQKPQEDEGLI